jgi:hypothetical protein
MGEAQRQEEYARAINEYAQARVERCSNLRSENCAAQKQDVVLTTTVVLQSQSVQKNFRMEILL